MDRHCMPISQFQALSQKYPALGDSPCQLALPHIVQCVHLLACFDDVYGTQGDVALCWR